MSRFITKTVHIVFAVLLTLIIFAFALNLGSRVVDGALGVVVTVVLLLLCALVVCFGGKILDSLKNKVSKPIGRLATWKMMVLIGLSSLLTKLFFIFLLDVDSTLHSDMQMYHSFANQIAQNGEITEYINYATKHNYTVIYGLVLSPFAKLFGSDPKVLTIVLTVFMSITSVLLFDIVRKRTGNTIAFCGVLLYNFLPVGMFQTQLLVHETFLLFFGMLGFWLMLRALDKKRHTAIRIVDTVLAGVCVGIGASVNAGGYVMLISLCIISFVRIVGGKISFKRLTCTVCVILVLAISAMSVGGLLSTAAQNSINTGTTGGYCTEKQLPFGWGLYLGMNYETSGVINKEDADTYHKFEGFETPEEAKEYQKNLVAERLEYFADNPGLIPVHLFKKLQVLWGSLWLSFPYAQGNAVENFIMTGAGGILYKGIYMSNALVYLAVLSMILLSLKNKVKKGNKEYDDHYPNLHCKMVIIGVTAALICFEVSTKYVSHMHILMYAIWMFQLKDFVARSNLIREKLVAKLKRAA